MLCRTIQPLWYRFLFSKMGAASKRGLQFSSIAQSCTTLWPHGLQHTRLPCPSPTPGAYSDSSPLSWWPSNNLILRHPLFLLPSILPSIGVFTNDLALCIRWLKNWRFSFRISPSNEYSRLLAFKIDLFGLLVVQESLKSLLQHCSSNASIL